MHGKSVAFAHERQGAEEFWQRFNLLLGGLVPETQISFRVRADSTLPSMRFEYIESASCLKTESVDGLAYNGALRYPSQIPRVICVC
jgi:hypothetical protein